MLRRFKKLNEEDNLESDKKSVKIFYECLYPFTRAEMQGIFLRRLLRKRQPILVG